MKRWALPVGMLSLALASVAWLQQSQSNSRTGFLAPDFELPDLSGRMQRLSDLRGRVVFLNLWTTWCPPCRTEMPDMEELYHRLKGRDFAMIAVSEDENGSAVVAPFVTQNRLSFPVLLDPEGRLSTRYGATGYPETFIIDRAGQVVNHIIGPADWTSPQILDYFERLLERGADGLQPARAAE
jgi:peroxiredoxin